MTNVDETRFTEIRFEKFQTSKKCLIPKDPYSEYIEELKKCSKTEKKTRFQYYLLSWYEILQCGDTEKLISKRQSEDDQPVYYATIEGTYDIIKKAHIATGHGGRDRMIKYLSPKVRKYYQEEGAAEKEMTGQEVGAVEAEMKEGSRRTRN